MCTLKYGVADSFLQEREDSLRKRLSQWDSHFTDGHTNKAAIAQMLSEYIIFTDHSPKADCMTIVRDEEDENKKLVAIMYQIPESK